MQVRLSSNIFLGGNEAQSTLYIYKTIDNKAQIVGKILVDPPLYDRNDRHPEPPYPGHRLHVQLSPEHDGKLTPEEFQEVMDKAIEKIPVLDRIWLIRNFGPMLDALRRFAVLLPDLRSIPPLISDDNFWELKELADRIDEEIDQLRYDCRPPQGEKLDPDIRAKLDDLRFHPARQLVWAYEDAQNEVPRNTLNSLKTVNPKYWKTLDHMPIGDELKRLTKTFREREEEEAAARKLAEEFKKNWLHQPKASDE